MADVKISQLPTAIPTSASLVPIVEGGVTSQTTPSALVSVATSSVKAGNGDYTLETSDVGQVVVSNIGSPATFTVQDSASFPVGGVIEVVQENSGQLTLAEGAGTTIKRSRFATLELGGEGSTVRLRKQGAGTWIASGDLKTVQPSFRFRIEDVSVTGTGSQMNATSLTLVAGNNIAEMAELSSGQVRILQSGTWLFSANMSVTDSEAGASRSVTLDLERNGSAVIAFNGRREGTTTSLLVPVRGTYAATIQAGDLVSITINSSGTINPTSGSSQRDFWAQRVSD